MVIPSVTKCNLMVGVGPGFRDIREPDRNKVGLSKQLNNLSKSNELDENRAMSNHNPSQSTKSARKEQKELSQKERKLVGPKKKPRYWTDEEDRLLESAVEAVKKEGNPKHAGDNMWKKVSAYVPNRAWRECLQRWTKVLVPGLKKGKWSPAEDDTLLALVNTQIKINPLKICWPEVSKGMGDRSCKQCRERWINHLDPNVKKGDWTAKEDEILLKVGEQFPAKWAKIARHIPGRTENTVKVRWKILKRQEWKPDEDRELLRLTAMYPRQWRTIANKLPGRNERNVKQRLHVLSKEKPEAFSFLENLPSPKVHKKGTMGKKRSSPSKPRASTQKIKRQRLQDKAEATDVTTQRKLDTYPAAASQKQEKENSGDKDVVRPLARANGLDMLLQTATQAQGVTQAGSNTDSNVMKPNKLGSISLASAVAATQAVQASPQPPITVPTPQLPHVDSPTLQPVNPFSMLSQSPFQYPVPLGGAQALNQTPMQPGLPFFGQMPFVYNDPTSTMAYIANLSAQLNIMKQNNKSTTDTTTSNT